MSKDTDKIKEIEAKLEVYENSPYAQTYLTIYKQIADMNEQLSISDEDVERHVGFTKEGVPMTIKIKKGKLDLFAPAEMKEFDRAWKYLNEAPELLASLDKLREKMKPEEQERARQGDALNNFFGKNGR